MPIIQKAVIQLTDAMNLIYGQPHQKNLELYIVSSNANFEIMINGKLR